MTVDLSAVRALVENHHTLRSMMNAMTKADKLPGFDHFVTIDVNYDPIADERAWDWCTREYGPCAVILAMDPQTFSHVMSVVDPEARWMRTSQFDFYFRNANDAMLFKLTWAGK